MIRRNFWLLVGSQTLYGDDVLRTVDNRAKEMVQYLNEGRKLHKQDARLNSQCHILFIQLKKMVHQRQIEHDSAAESNRTANETGS